MAPFDWRQLLEIAAPAVGEIATGHNGDHGAFLSGYMHGQSLAQEKQQHEQEKQQRQRQLSADYLLKIGEHANGLTDPVDFENFMNLAETAGTKANYLKPGEARSAIKFNATKQADAQLKELSAQLDSLEKNGYNLDDLSASGSHLELKGGKQIPIGTAMDLTRRRPMGAGNAPIAAPNKTSLQDKIVTVNGVETLAGWDPKTNKYYDQSMNVLPGAQPVPKKDARPAGGAEGQFEDLVALWKEGHPGQDPPAAVRAQLRVKATRQLDKPPTNEDLSAFGPGGPAAAAVPTPTAPGQRNESVLAGLPSGTQAIVKALVDGRQQFPTGTALKSGYWQKMLELVGKYDPSFDTINYNARSKTRADFTSGKSAAQVNALNTVIGHLSDLSDAADSLKNSWSPTWNSIANAAKTATGNKEVKQFDTIANAVADEATRVWRQAGGTEADIRSWKNDLASAGSPAQLHGVIATIGDLLNSKLEALQAQNEQGMGTAGVKMIAPKAETALQKLRGRAGTGTAAPTGGVIRARDPQGKLHEAKAGTPLPAGWTLEP